MQNLGLWTPTWVTYKDKRKGGHGVWDRLSLWSHLMNPELLKLLLLFFLIWSF